MQKIIIISKTYWNLYLLLFLFLFIFNTNEKIFEELTSIDLIGEGKKIYSENLAIYSYKIEEGILPNNSLNKNASYHRFYPVLKEIIKLDKIESFELSFSVGKASNNNINLLGLNFPSYGSSIWAKTKSEDEFIQLTFLLSGWLGLTNHKISKFQRFWSNPPNINKTGIFFSSHTSEILCHQHFYKLRKNLPKSSLVNTIWKNLQDILDSEYASVTVKYNRELNSQSDSQSLINLDFILRLLKTSKNFERKFKAIKDFGLKSQESDKFFLELGTVRKNFKTAEFSIKELESIDSYYKSSKINI